MKKAILVVSFGTSHKDTREKTISVIRDDIKRTFGDYKIYEAWTSHMIRKKVKETEKLLVFGVAEAMEEMKKDNITDVIIQPTHVINGVENDLMKEQVLLYESEFSSLAFGTPLLTTASDYTNVVQILEEEFCHVNKKEAIVLMGHGTKHHANSAYAALAYECQDKGLKNVFLGTVEAYPDLSAILRGLEEFKPQKVHLAMLMMVAGDHAKNDLAGEEKDSWNSVLTQKGYDTVLHMKGLGEYPKIRQIFISHIKQAQTLQEAKSMEK